MALIRFVRNHNDESTDRGFQFEFFCDRCGAGYRTAFKPSHTGPAAGALDLAGGLLGGIFGQAADIGRHVHSAAWERAHDAAFEEAVEEATPHFQQCPRCQAWVCAAYCWNEDRGLCKNCAPDLAVEMSAMQATAAILDAAEVAHAALADKVAAADFDGVIQAKCPKCGTPVRGGKFCANCGTPLAAEKFCTECGAKIAAGAKFCPECGGKQA